MLCEFIKEDEPVKGFKEDNFRKEMETPFFNIFTLDHLKRKETDQYFNSFVELSKNKKHLNAITVALCAIDISGKNKSVVPRFDVN